jgi:hypothetical protein
MCFEAVSVGQKVPTKPQQWKPSKVNYTKFLESVSENVAMKYCNQFSILRNVRELKTYTHTNRVNVSNYNIKTFYSTLPQFFDWYLNIVSIFNFYFNANGDCN